ncbi:ABC transporter substrate-binding protein [Microbacterium sp. YY-01]|uniref:ABC transporter substrate-binding protein n=1 Tax=Microbacterium sp. YY-01 TaxID=3421634 RepID=UPI003D16B268
MTTPEVTHERRTTVSLAAKKRSGFAMIGALAGMALLAGCSGAGNAPAANTENSIISQEACDRNSAEKITYISGYGYSASAGQLDVFMAKELGYFDELCLNVEINAAGGNGQQLVSSGKAHFTELGSAEDVLMAAANSQNLTAIATFGTTSPFCLFANKDIKDLKDLEGKQLGYFINLTPVAVAMIDAAGADIDKINLVKMTNYDPTVVLRSQPDAIVGYASNQCETLRSMGEEFTEFTPADFDLEGTYNVMEVNKEFYEKNPEVVADFMRADLKALQYCLDNEEDCIERIAALAKEGGQGDAFPIEQLRRTWKVESQWVRDSTAGAPGVQTVEQWQAASDIVKAYGNVKNIPDVTDIIDVDLVANLYDANGNLIWPGEGDSK